MKKKHSNSIPRSIKKMYPNVKTIIDAKHAVEITVNAKDCKSGEALNPSECALAKAVKRQFHADAAIIGLGASYIIKGSKATRFHTPERIRREIISFDRHNDFAEGSYQLTRKSPTLRLGYRASGKHKTHRNSHTPIRHTIKSARVRVLGTRA